MASTDQASIALDELEATIGSILMQTGSAFANASKADIIRLSRTTTRVRQFAPKAVASMHDQLDILEIQLQNAHSLLRQGLALTKAKASGAPTTEQPLSEPVSVHAPAEEKKAGEDVAISQEDAMDDIFMDDDLFESPTDAAKPELGAPPAKTDLQVTSNAVVEQESEVTAEPTTIANGIEDEPLNPAESGQQQSSADLGKQADGDAKVTEDNNPEIPPSKVNNGTNHSEQHKEGTLNNEAMDLSNDDANLLSGIEDYANDSGMAGFEGMSSFEDINNSNFEIQDDLLNGNLGVDFAEDLQNNSEFENLFSLDNFGSGTGDGQTNFDDIKFDDNFFNLDGT